MPQWAGPKVIQIPKANTASRVIAPATVVSPGSANDGARVSLKCRPTHHVTVRQTGPLEYNGVTTTSMLGVGLEKRYLNYLYLRNLNDTERDFFAEVKAYLTKGSDYFTNGSSATSDQWLACCVFQNESCQTTLQTFIQLH